MKSQNVIEEAFGVICSSSLALSDMASSGIHLARQPQDHEYLAGPGPHLQDQMFGFASEVKQRCSLAALLDDLSVRCPRNANLELDQCETRTRCFPVDIYSFGMTIIIVIGEKHRYDMYEYGPEVLRREQWGDERKSILRHNLKRYGTKWIPGFAKGTKPQGYNAENRPDV